MKKIVIAAAISTLSMGICSAVAENGTIELHSNGRIERSQVTYDCGGQGLLVATYVNADPNFLAILTVPGQRQPTVFASVISGSGARYAAGKYVWWTKGNTASLYDTTLGDNAPPTMTCVPSN
jgi:membrane-bound inhibitor of C-type lysozyme